MTKAKTFKILGLIASVGTLAASLFEDWVYEQEMNAKIEEKVNECLKEKLAKKK